MALTYDDLDTAVRKKYIPVLVEQIFVANALLARLMAKSKVIFDSGRKIVQPVIYAQLAGGSYWGLDTFDISYKKTQTMAEWDWKGIYVNVTIPGTDIAIAEGDEKIMGILESKMETASMTKNELFSTQIQGDGTGNSGKDFDGLLNAIDDGSTYPVYGGIERTSDMPSWQANLDSTGGAVTVDAINAMLGKCTIGEKKPDLIITTQTLYDKIWSRVQPQQRFLGTQGKHSDLAGVGFSGIDFNGHAAILVDNHCPSGYMYFLNTEYWKLVLNKNKNFSWTEQKTPTDQDAYVRQLLTIGNLICQSPRLQGVMTGLS